MKHGDISFSDTAPNHTISFGRGQIWSRTTPLHSVRFTFEMFDIYMVECIELVSSTLEVNVLHFQNPQNNANDFPRMYTKRGTSNSRVTVKDLSLGFIPTDCFELFYLDNSHLSVESEHVGDGKELEFVIIDNLTRVCPKGAVNRQILFTIKQYTCASS